MLQSKTPQLLLFSYISLVVNCIFLTVKSLLDAFYKHSWVCSSAYTEIGANLPLVSDYLQIYLIVSVDTSNIIMERFWKGFGVRGNFLFLSFPFNTSSLSVRHIWHNTQQCCLQLPLSQKSFSVLVRNYV